MRFQSIIVLLIATSVLADAQVAKKTFPAPKLDAIVQATVWRVSDNQDEHGHFLPPWKQVRIASIARFKFKPNVDSAATVIPLDADIAPFTLKIIKADETKVGCLEQTTPTWEIDFEPLSDKKFFDAAPVGNRSAEYPFEVVILYPAIKSARQVKKDFLTQKLLPKGIALSTVKAAIDLTNDGLPDVLIAEYCCNDTQRPAEGCDLTCGKIFTRTGKNWQLGETLSPC